MINTNAEVIVYNMFLNFLFLFSPFAFFMPCKQLTDALHYTALNPVEAIVLSAVSNIYNVELFQDRSQVQYGIPHSVSLVFVRSGSSATYNYNSTSSLIFNNPFHLPPFKYVLVITIHQSHSCFLYQLSYLSWEGPSSQDSLVLLLIWLGKTHLPCAREAQHTCRKYGLTLCPPASPWLQTRCWEGPAWKPLVQAGCEVMPS